MTGYAYSPSACSFAYGRQCASLLHIRQMLLLWTDSAPVCKSWSTFNSRVQNSVFRPMLLARPFFARKVKAKSALPMILSVLSDDLTPGNHKLLACIACDTIPCMSSSFPLCILTACGVTVHWVCLVSCFLRCIARVPSEYLLSFRRIVCSIFRLEIDYYIEFH